MADDLRETPMAPRRRVEVGKGVSQHRDQRNRWRTLVEYPDRLEAAHVRHEDVDDHQINVPLFSAARPLSPSSVIATLNPHCLSHMPMARRVCRSPSTTRMRRMATSLGVGSTVPLMIETAFHPTAPRLFALR